MAKKEKSSYINICRYKFLRRKVQYFYAQKSIFYDYFKLEVLDYHKKCNSLEMVKYHQLIEMYIKLQKMDKIYPKYTNSKENITELLYFQNILVLEFVLNEIVNNKFDKETIINNSFREIFYVLRNLKLFHKFTTDCYYEIYRYLLQLVSCDHLELKEKNEKSFYKYDEYLNNSFERTKDIFINKRLKFERFMYVLSDKLSISFDDIIKDCEDKLLNIENAFINYFTNTKIDAELEKNIDLDLFTEKNKLKEMKKYTNVNLQLKINTFEKHSHFFSFFEELDLDTVELDGEKKIVFPLFVISLRNALLKSCLIESIKETKDLKKAKRILEKFIRDEKESLKDRTEAYIFLTILSNRDLRFRNLDLVFLCHYLSLSYGQTERFIKTRIYLERKDTFFNIQDVPMDVQAVKKFYYLLDKTYFENSNIKDFLSLYAERIDSEQFKFNLHEDLKKFLENETE